MLLLKNPLKFWNQRMDRWLSRRIPDDRQFRMDMSNIFIFPSKFGTWFLLLSVTLFILGSNYRNNLMLLLCFFLLSLFLVTLMSSFANFARLKVQLGRITPVFAGEQIQIPLWLSNNSDSADSNELPEGKLHFRFWQGPIQISVDPAQHSNPAMLVMDPKPRGVHTIPRVTIEAYYPLGLYRCWTHLRFSAKAMVYPKPIPCEINTLIQGNEGDEGNSSRTQAGMEDFDSLKSYIQGEPLHRIAWKQVAKGQGMVSKQFSGDSPEVHWLSPGLFHDDDTETMLGKMCHMVIVLSARQQYFGLTLNGRHTGPANGERHKETCLNMLALYGSDE